MPRRRRYGSRARKPDLTRPQIRALIAHRRYHGIDRPCLTWRDGVCSVGTIAALERAGLVSVDYLTRGWTSTLTLTGALVAERLANDPDTGGSR